MSKQKNFFVELGSNMIFGTLNVLLTIVTSEPFIIVAVIVFIIAILVGAIWLLVFLIGLLGWLGIPLFILIVIFLISLLVTLNSRIHIL